MKNVMLTAAIAIFAVACSNTENETKTDSVKVDTMKTDSVKVDTVSVNTTNLITE